MMMSHWGIAEALASEHRRDLEVDAARRRLARLARCIDRARRARTSSSS